MNVFLVVSGIFADVGKPSPSGGSDDAGHVPQQITQTFNGKRGAKPALHGRQNTMEAMKAQVQTQHLFPYRLYGWGNYFGLAEVLDAKERSSSVRCESEMGVVLVLQKMELNRLMEEFPQFAMAWRSQSRRREQLRVRLRSRLTVGTNHKRFAAVRIQRAFRAYSGSGGSIHIEDHDIGPDAFSARLATSSPRTFTDGSSCECIFSAADAQTVRRLLVASEAQAKDIRDVRVGMDAMRADLASFQKEMRMMLVGRAAGGDGRPHVAVQGAAYGSAGELSI